jgi:hypothetical protein
VSRAARQARASGPFKNAAVQTNVHRYYLRATSPAAGRHLQQALQTSTILVFCNVVATHWQPCKPVYSFIYILYVQILWNALSLLPKFTPVTQQDLRSPSSERASRICSAKRAFHLPARASAHRSSRRGLRAELHADTLDSLALPAAASLALHFFMLYTLLYASPECQISALTPYTASSPT